MPDSDRQTPPAAWKSVLALERAEAGIWRKDVRAPADLLAAEFVLREIVDEEEASGAIRMLWDAGFTIIAPQNLVEAAKERDRRG